MSDNCENFKSPSQLGLLICTSDVPCYNGVSLQCIDLPSNPSLNDVISSIDTKICLLQSLVNNIVVPSPVIPDDPWVVLDELSAEITGVSGTGTAVYNTIDVDVAYKVLSPSHAILKVKGNLDVNTLLVNDTIGFQFFLANVQNADSGWFTSGEKVFTSLFSESQGVPISVVRTGGDVLPTHNEDYDSKGRASVTSGVVFCQRVAPVVDGGLPHNHTFLIEWEIMCKLQDL